MRRRIFANDRGPIIPLQGKVVVEKMAHDKYSADHLGNLEPSDLKNPDWPTP